MANTQEVPKWAWDAVVEFNNWARGREAEIREMIGRWLASEGDRLAAVKAVLPEKRGETWFVRNERRKFMAQWELEHLIPEDVVVCRSVARLVAVNNAVMSKTPVERAEELGWKCVDPRLNTLAEQVAWALLFPSTPEEWPTWELDVEASLAKVKSKWDCPTPAACRGDVIRSDIADLRDDIGSLRAGVGRLTDRKENATLPTHPPTTGPAPTVDIHSPPQPRYMLRQGIGHWLFTVDGLGGNIAAEKGLQYVEYLFKNPPTEPIHATDLEAQVSEMDTHADGVTEIVDPLSGKLVTLARTARLQERNLSTDNRESNRRIWKYRQSRQRIIDDDNVTDMERDEARSEIDTIDKVLASNILRDKDNAAKTYDRIRNAINRLLDHLEAKTTKNGKKEPAYEALAEHIRRHVLSAKRRFARTRTLAGTAQTFTYERPVNVIWSD